MADARAVTIEYSIFPQGNGHYVTREQKGDPLTNDEALHMLKSEMIHVTLAAMGSARAAGVPDEIAAFAMKEIITRAADDAVKRAYEYLKSGNSHLTGVHCD